MKAYRHSFVILVVIIFFISLDVKAQEVSLTQQDKKSLVTLARKTLHKFLKDGSTQTFKARTLSKSLQKKRACFVTLTKKGYGLRGCIGVFERNRPLYENVIDRAIAAATKDPRFPRVTYDELKDIKIEISVLTEPKPLVFHSPEDLLAKLRPLKDGIILKTRYGSSTFLPQVWEQLPGKESFLSHLSQKHGAPKNIWKTDYKKVSVLTYQAIVFGEENYGGLISDSLLGNSDIPEAKGLSNPKK